MVMRRSIAGLTLRTAYSQGDLIRIPQQVRRELYSCPAGHQEDTALGWSCPVAKVLLSAFSLRRSCSWLAGAPYDIEVFVSGYVVKHKAHNTLSRSQRNILGLAKRWRRSCLACLYELNTLIRYRFPPEATRSTPRLCRGPPPA
jgi:hypothetical protein